MAIAKVVDDEDERGWTAFHYAADAGQAQVMQLLMSFNANAMRLTLTADSALLLACR
jgi:ankyrin repeat protein